MAEVARVKTGLPRDGAWICLLECGCEVTVEAIKRPRQIEHEHQNEASPTVQENTVRLTRAAEYLERVLAAVRLGPAPDGARVITTENYSANSRR